MKIGLLGFGTVGTGVLEIIGTRNQVFKELYKEPVEITKILVKDKGKKRDIEGIDGLLTTNAYEILDDPTIDVIVEVIGGVAEAYEYIKYALEKGKHVVTANKAVVALHMKELLQLAAEKQKSFLFEASVGGGIPLLKPLRQTTVLNDFSEIKGILNGTSNFILTKMTEDDLSFNEALGIAQEMGYAEADPSDDIHGTDIARKLAILSSIAFKNDISLNNVKYRGIEKINKEDISILKELGYTVKLLGKAVVKNQQVSALVEPVLFKNTTQFEKVNNAYNMVSVKGNNLQELRFYGEGAGKLATANAVVCDLLDVLTKSYEKDFIIRESQRKLTGVSLILGKYFIRINSENADQIKKVEGFIYDKGINYSRLIDKDFAIITEVVSAIEMEEIAKEFDEMNLDFFYGRIEKE